MNLLTLDEKLKTVEVMGYKFKIRFMSPIDRIAITQKRLTLQNGNPIETLTDSDFIFFENVAMVDNNVEETPQGFKEYESCVKWTDEIDLINKIAEEIRQHTKDLESKLKKNKPIIGSEKR